MIHIKYKVIGSFKKFLNLAKIYHKLNFKDSLANYKSYNINPKIYFNFSPNFLSPQTPYRWNPNFPISTMSIPPSSATTSSSSSQFTYQTTTNSSYFPLPFHLQQQAQSYVPPAQSVPIAPAPVYPAPVAPVPSVYSLPQYQQVSKTINYYKVSLLFITL